MTAAWTVRRAALADLEALIEIQRECPETSHWSEAVWRGILQRSDREVSARAVWLAETWPAEVRPAEVRPAEIQRAPSGLAVVHCMVGGAELENLAVRPEYRRRGVARSLCHHAIEWAAVHAAAQRGGAVTGFMTETPAMHLEVRAGNAAALELYAALGFAEQGRRKSYYQDPLDDAVLMTRRLDDAAT